MIVTFYGTETSKNYAPQFLSACAFETAYGLSRKTLVLQFCQDDPVEILLIGKQMVIGEIDTGISEDTGIETLIRKTRTKGLKDDHFTTYTKQILSAQKSKNNFDVATIPKLVDFKKEIVNDKDVVRELLERAEHIYDSIFVLADGQDEKLITMLSDLTEKRVVCIEQGNKQNVFCADNKTIYLVPDYDERSLYNIKHLKKSYGANTVIPIPYNVSFKDASKTNNILRFLYENNDKSDSQNGNFVNILKEISAHIAGTNVREMNNGIVEWNFKNIELESREAIEKKDIAPEQIEIRTEKKHFWSRKKTVVHVKSEEELEKEGTFFENLEMNSEKEDNSIKNDETALETKMLSPENEKSILEEEMLSEQKEVFMDTKETVPLFLQGIQWYTYFQEVQIFPLLLVTCNSTKQHKLQII